MIADTQYDIVKPVLTYSDTLYKDSVPDTTMANQATNSSQYLTMESLIIVLIIVALLNMVRFGGKD